MKFKFNLKNNLYDQKNMLYFENLKNGNEKNSSKRINKLSCFFK